MRYLSVSRVLGALIIAAVTLAWPMTSGASVLPTSPVVNVWTEPASGYGFLDSAIDAAHHSIDVSMYELSDTTIQRELIARANAGVDVRVLLDSAYAGARENAGAYTELRASKVHVEWAPTGQISHAKYVLIDRRIAYIGTGNLQSFYYASTRDFWVEDVRSADVVAIEQTFDGDFVRSSRTSDAGGLVWSPGSTSALVALIDGARRSLLVENEEMDSAGIEAALASAARRGVSVKVVMTESSSTSAPLEALARNGVHVRVLSSSQVYIHAKVICADCVAGAGTVFIGSENFSTSSLSYNRELGLVTTTPRAVNAVDSTVNGDYAVGRSVTPPPSTPVTNSGTGAITVTSFQSSISPGGEDSLSVRVLKPGETCDLNVILPSGYQSQSHGLGPEVANAQGSVTWTWEIGLNTDPGTAHATITCGAKSIQRPFQIR